MLKDSSLSFHVASMSSETRTQVCIIGGGPAGMLLAHGLDLAGIETIVLERQSRDYVLSRIRAGMLESGSVDFIRQLSLAERLDQTGFQQKEVHYGFYGKETLVLDLMEYTGRHLIGYGQTYLTEDVYNASHHARRKVVHGVENVVLNDLKYKPSVAFEQNGQQSIIRSDFIVGCDGFHGVSRNSIPVEHRKEWERVYPFGWLGILAEVPPMKELFYALGPEGFALASKRTPDLSRYYIQCHASDRVEDWSDDRFWENLLQAIPEDYRSKVTTGPSVEKSIAPLRSFVSEPMRYGCLFLAGDAAHIVPPTGAKGLNLAISDVYYLSRALDQYFNHAGDQALEDYSRTALKRVWSAVNLSWSLTKLLHRFPDEDPFDQKIRENQFDLLLAHEPMRIAMAFEKVGLPL